jgi:peptidyl-prolyl cis-trans isomerase B (cyclophilin B)
VPSNEQRRQAAKRKLERQLARRAERAKRRRIWGVSITIGVVIVAVGLVYWLVNLGPSDSEAAPGSEDTSTTNPDATKGACGYAPDPSGQAATAGLPDDPEDTPKTGTVTVTLKTSQGDIPMALDREKAPCTVQSILHLVNAKFYDGLGCHRLVGSEGLKVLQCGDPNGDGTGGPGYTIPDELTSAQALADGPADQSGTTTKIYPRGAIAMANGGPNTGGSQFFLVYGDSTLPPNYTVFGTVDEAGLATLDAIAAGGITPGANGAEDGSPTIPVTIQKAEVA